jgi:hypothetical protein
MLNFLNLTQEGKMKINNLLLYATAINAIVSLDPISTILFGLSAAFSFASDFAKPKSSQKDLQELTEKVLKLQRQMTQTRMQIGLQRGE